MDRDQVFILMFLALGGAIAIASHSMVRNCFVAAIISAGMTAGGTTLSILVYIVLQHLPAGKVSYIPMVSIPCFFLAFLASLSIGVPFVFLRRFESIPEQNTRLVTPPGKGAISLSLVLGVLLIWSVSSVGQGMQQSNRDNKLMEAVHFGTAADVERVLASGVDVNAQDGQALMLASFYGRIDIVSLLLKKGADPNCPRPYGNTPLKCATQNRHTEVVQLLRQAGAN